MTSVVGFQAGKSDKINLPHFLLQLFSLHSHCDLADLLLKCEVPEVKISENEV